MKQFIGEEIRTFLRAVDKYITKPFRLDVIGGAAAALSFRAESGTVDIDTTASTAEIEEACKKARSETGLSIPLGSAGVYDGPYEYETRLKRLPLKGLVKLQIFIPEKHDWALMKIVRLLQKDIEDIREVSKTIGFDKDVFLNRFLREMTHVMGPRQKLVNNFLAMMEELFGSDESNRMEKTIRADNRWK